MKHRIRFAGNVASWLVLAVSLSGVAARAATLETPKLKKFLTKPLVIEDQGSFFIGGVPKVTSYATVPGPNQVMTPQQITIGRWRTTSEMLVGVWSAFPGSASTVNRPPRPGRGAPRSRRPGPG